MFLGLRASTGGEASGICGREGVQKCLLSPSWLSLPSADFGEPQKAQNSDAHYLSPSIDLLICKKPIANTCV